MDNVKRYTNYGLRNPSWRIKEQDIPKVEVGLLLFALSTEEVCVKKIVGVVGGEF